MKFGKGGSIKYNGKYITRVFAGLAIYWFLSPLILKIESELFEINTESELFKNIYYRVYVNTTWFPLAQFFSYMVFCAYGWTYISLVTLQRSDPFEGPNPDYRDFKIMLTTVPILFFLSGVIVFR